MCGFSFMRSLPTYPTRRSSDLMLLDGEEVSFTHPSDAIQRGIAMVTEDRKRSGFVPNLSTGENITLPNVRQFGRNGILRLRSEEHTSELQSPDQFVCRLSLYNK